MQELGLENAWVSELIFTSLFVAFVLWTFSPFVFARKRFYTSLLYSQVLSTLVGEANFHVTACPSSPVLCRDKRVLWWPSDVSNVQGAHACASDFVVLLQKAKEHT